MKQEKQNPFIKYNGIKDAKKHIHKASGLYDASNEHDACGVGMIVDIHGNKSHELVDSALKVLENMKHRGAEGADNKTGDGAGIMLQIPHEFILLQGIPVPEKGKYGTGLVFLPKDGQEQSHMLSIMIEEIEREGLNLMHLRNVPVNSSILGKDALGTEPSIKQVFITGSTDTENLERTLYIIRKRIARRKRTNLLRCATVFCSRYGARVTRICSAATTTFSSLKKMRRPSICAAAMYISKATTMRQAASLTLSIR